MFRNSKKSDIEGRKNSGSQSYGRNVADMSRI